MAWALDEEYGSAVVSVAFGAHATNQTGAEMNVSAGMVVDASCTVGSYTDGSHVVSVEWWNGSAWVTAGPISGSGTLPTVNTGSLANTTHLASFLVPSGVTKVRGYVGVVGATTGAWTDILLRSRQMILAVV